MKVLKALDVGEERYMSIKYVYLASIKRISFTCHTYLFMNCDRFDDFLFTIEADLWMFYGILGPFLSNILPVQ